MQHAHDGGSRIAPAAPSSAQSRVLGGTTQADTDLFAGGPSLRLKAHPVRPAKPNVARRVALVVLIGWLPLAVLAGVQSAGLGADGWGSFVSDFAVHARSLVAAPLLIVAEAVCIPRLGAITRHFLDAGLVGEADRARFDEASASTRRLRDSALAEVGVVIVTYGLIAALAYAVPAADLPEWHRSGGSASASYSLSGWWHALVSVPLLIFLFFGWMWRLFLWTRFLWLVSRFQLHLIPSHPDKSAGLAFVGYSLRAWSILGFTLGVIAAGRVGNSILHRDMSLLDEKYVIAGVVAFALFLFTCPLLAFSGNLLRAWRRGVFDYGALADRFGQQFERKWLGHRKTLDESVLQAPDASTMTDLYQLVDRVYDMRFIPVDLKSVIVLALATLLPFVPVALMAVPLDEIVSKLASLLF